MSNENKSFTVKDRRLFTSDGELRGEAPSAAEPEAPASPSFPAAAPPRAPREAGPGPVVELSGFLMSLGSQAMDALMARPPQLEQARTLIAVLEMLADKTEGRRTDDETEVLESLLYQLRLGFVEQAKAGRA